MNAEENRVVLRVLRGTSGVRQSQGNTGTIQSTDLNDSALQANGTVAKRYTARKDTAYTRSISTWPNAWILIERFRLEGAIDTLNLFLGKNLKQSQNGTCCSTSTARLPMDGAIQDKHS